MMRISAPGCCKRPRGFTLIEILLVMAIIALGSGLMTLSLQRTDEAKLRADARALGRFFQQVAVEAAVRGETLRVVETNGRFRVARAAEVEGGDDDALPGLTLAARVVETSLDGEMVFPPGGGGAFRLTLDYHNQRFVVARDALGRIAVRQPS